jgi:hypothetical protein
MPEDLLNTIKEGGKLKVEGRRFIENQKAKFKKQKAKGDGKNSKFEFPVSRF